ncbi:MAG TPA: DUF1573 domain-containing protein [Bacteroidota bacterium]|nr:DUF1573 domain-containing protein [Bacteroidota bacterium]
MQFWKGGIVRFQVKLCCALFLLFYHAPPVASQPKLVIDKPEIDLGVIFNGGSKSTKWILKNGGTDTLKFFSITPSCGCTAAKQPKKFLLPGESDALEVTFNSTGFRGKQSKYVNIHTNDPNEPYALLTLRAEVLEELEPTTKTSIAWLGTLPLGKQFQHAISFRNISNRAVRIKKVTSSSPKLGVKVETRSVGPRDSISVNVTVTPDKEGYFHEQFFLETDSKNQPIVPMRVSFIGVKGN